MTSRILYVAARVVDGATPDREDAHVQGIHAISIGAGVPPALAANAALDIFHSHVPVGELDCFEFLVVQPNNGLVLEQGEADGDMQLTDEGDVLGSDPLPQGWHVARLRVLAEGSGRRVELGSVVIAGTNHARMQQHAVDMLWNESLRQVGLSPAVEDEQAGNEPGEVER